MGKGIVEYRYRPMTACGRESTSGVGILDGHAAVFNVSTVVGNWFEEVIRPGAFKKTFQEGKWYSR